MPQTILLTDGNAAARRILRRFLAPLGTEIIEADEPDHALKVLRVVQVDLVVADLDMMAEVDGVSRVTAARELPDGEVRSGVPIILLTASRQPGSEEAALRAGASAVLPKPIDPSRIVATARRLLRRPREAAAPAAG